MKTRLVQRVHV